MTKVIDAESLLQAKIADGLSENDARKTLRLDAKKLFNGDASLFEAYGAKNASEAMRISRQINAYLDGDALALAETDFTDVDIKDLKDTVDEDGFSYTAEEKKASYDKIFHDKELNRKKRIIFDAIKNVITYICAAISLIVLVLIVYYCFATGGSTFSWSFITGDNSAHQITTNLTERIHVDPEVTYEVPDEILDNEAFSEKWGVLFAEGEKTDGSHDLMITYVDPESPFYALTDKDTGEVLDYSNNYSVMNVGGLTEEGGVVAFNRNSSAKDAVEILDSAVTVYSFIVEIGGFGIRGPLIATLWMILFSLLFSLPLGIGAAIYLAYYAKKNKITAVIRSMIDMISGIPSIIFGLAGAVIFIPIFSGGGATGTILSGAATLACMVLPTIIKNTEEAINVIPSSLKNASLALGASQTQTVFKVILPNSVPGILTGGLLATGRIVGESAALIFATGAVISDSVGPNQSSAATLAVYIWRSVSGQENPNYRSTAAAAILILIVVLLLNITVKLIADKLDKFTPKKKNTFFLKIWGKIKEKISVRKETQKAILASGQNKEITAKVEEKEGDKNNE